MKTFDELGLNKTLLKAVSDLGFEKPTPVQEQAIPQILNSDQDLIALAQTGTGKTAAFGLPIIQKINQKEKGIQVLVLCPIRELCLQITKDMNNFISGSSNLKVTAVYGGDSISRQASEIKNGTNIIVGTPGRVKDMINRKILKLDSVKFVVLDEADEMLDMGFKEELDFILATIPEEKQTLLFSATMPDLVRRIASKYMKNPWEIRTGTENKGADNVKHEYYAVHAKDRYEALRRILDSLPNVYGILFCRTRRETQEVASKLARDNYRAEAIHGDIAQSQRTKIMESFRNKEIRLLVATDVAARGIDVKGLSHIINYNLPDSNETYIHRSGRTGRADAKGVSISIINTRERRVIKDLERIVKKPFELKKVPSGSEICEKQLFNIIDKIIKTEVNELQIKDYLPSIYKKLDDLSKDELIKKVVSMEFNYFLGLYNKTKDLDAAMDVTGRFNVPASGFAVIQINFGRLDNFGVKDLLTLINSKTELKGIEVGRIQLEQKGSYFEIDKDLAELAIKLFKKSNYKFRPIQLEVVDKMPPKGKRTYEKSFKRNDRPRFSGKNSGKRGFKRKRY